MVAFSACFLQFINVLNENQSKNIAVERRFRSCPRKSGRDCGFGANPHPFRLILSICFCTLNGFLAVKTPEIPMKHLPWIFVYKD
jgi:hypothetical protein